jgi:hypothetical protein
MPIDDFLSQAPYPKDMDLWREIYALSKKVAKGEAKGLVQEKRLIGYRPGHNYMYRSSE